MPTGPRIVKRSDVRQQYNENDYREALPDLLQDFGDRCAFSMLHKRANGPIGQMEVDHFNPHLQGAEKHHYSNLYPACRHVNKKKAKFPYPRDVQAGRRLLDPCKETDYGAHIFENANTHELVAISPEGRVQIDVLDLNESTFVWYRQRRTELLSALSDPSVSQVPESLKNYLDADVEMVIPEIDPPAADAKLY